MERLFKVLNRSILRFKNDIDLKLPLILKMPFYAVAKGKSPGIFMTWADCETQVKGFPGAKYKKFNIINEAQDFINLHGSNIPVNVSHASSNLKRSHSTAAVVSVAKQNWSHVPRKKLESRGYSDNKSTEDDDSDDLNDILNNQMDDIEKRLKSVQKNVDNIIKKGTSRGKKTKLIDPPVRKKARTNNIELQHNSDGFIEVFTDGACSSNGKSGAKAGLGVYWGENHPLNVSEPVSGRATNNCGEIQAATKAINIALDNGITHLQINTDSKFLINSVTKWIPGWKRKGWKLKDGQPVKNEVDFKDLDRVKNQLTLKWKYVEAHKGILGNEMADQLAKDGAAMYNISI